jgi:tetraacyldisaccharide 4'-kinase
VGGTGKTPVALMVADHLLSEKFGVAFLSRGYGRNDTGLRIAKPHEKLPWKLIGDEPWLLHDRLPESWLGIHPDRVKSAMALAAQVPERAVYVLDDGFQHRALRRDLDIVCLHAPPENDRLVPAGNLREGPQSLARAQIVLFIGNGAKADALENYGVDLERRFPRLKAFSLIQERVLWVNADNGQTAEAPPLTNPLLICGIARPERFIAMVADAGITPCKNLVFPDHHQYITNDFNKTRELYSNGVITTEKDAVRLKKLGVVPGGTLWYLNIKLRFLNNEREKEFYLLIDKYISNIRKRRNYS